MRSGTINTVHPCSKLNHYGTYAVLQLHKSTIEYCKIGHYIKYGYLLSNISDDTEQSMGSVLSVYVNDYYIVYCQG